MNLLYSDPLTFRFYWMDENGNATSMFRKQGRFHENSLTLEETEIPVVAILHCVLKEDRLILSAATGDEEQPIVSFLIGIANAKTAKELKQRIDVARSSLWAAHHKTALAEKGQSSIYRDAHCDDCGATLILTNMPETPQRYCHFCDSLKTIDGTLEPIANEAEFRICESCGMYSRPKKFTTFYFYFLLVVWGFNSNSSYRCGGCMRGEAWKMLLGNFIFILGLPFAIYQLIRAYAGDTVTGKFKGLDKGNVKARAGNIDAALEQYEAILERVPWSAGVKYNLGLALIQKQDLVHATQILEMALEDCANYSPAYQHLCGLYEHQGETGKLTAIKQIWDDLEEPEEVTTADS